STTRNHVHGDHFLIHAARFWLSATIGIGAGEYKSPRFPSHTTGHSGPHHGGSID
ncbi:MAG: hypothetical protein ACI89E_000862, partial [Planctomycetota bacterium]